MVWDRNTLKVLIGLVLKISLNASKKCWGNFVGHLSLHVHLMK